MSALLPVYRRASIEMTRGEGAYLYDADGRRYLDFAAGIAVSSLGHCHPHLVGALKHQAETLWHCSNMYENEQLGKLASRLTQACFADKVFFCNSGTEAVECGIKMVRKYFSPPPLGGRSGGGHVADSVVQASPHPGPPPTGEGKKRYRIITMEGGFHGRTMACISAGGNAIAREGYGPLLEGFDRVEFNNIEAVRTAITPETAAVLIEPIQGEGGIREASTAFLQGVRKLCDEHGLLLFLDEVQCGMGRTGSLFAYEQAGITPDIVSVAKGIGGGFPLAACLATDRASKGMTPGTHGSTYGANPLAMAVGNAVLDVLLAPGFFAHVQEMGALLKAGLEKLVVARPELFKDVRGRGLMLGLQCVGSAREGVEKLRTRGLLTSPAEDNVIRITPPLIIQKEQVTEALAMLGTIV